MRTVADIIKDCGGAARIAEESRGAIKKDAVYKWPTIGVPDRHWPLLRRLTTVTPEELFEANVAAREAAA